LNHQGPPREGLIFREIDMWKIAVGFAIFAGLALFILSKGGDIDMGGEKHGAEAMHVPETPAPAAAPVAPAAPAPAASARP
jgi:hypothetical protein